jgi:hypothetical protein
MKKDKKEHIAILIVMIIFEIIIIVNFLNKFIIMVHQQFFGFVIDFFMYLFFISFLSYGIYKIMLRLLERTRSD